MPKPVTLKRKHALFSNADKPPRSICDSHGDVVLALCKVCDRAEAELSLDAGECPGYPNKGEELSPNTKFARPEKIVPVSVYTDGSASYKAGNGGWAFVALKGDTVAELWGFSDKTTISEMELLPIKEALTFLPLGASPIRIFCDSQYVVNSLNVWAPGWRERGWMSGIGKRPAHWKLIKEICELLEKHRERRSVSVVWIPGHTKHKHNERADVLAGAARKGKLTNLEG